MAIIFTKDLNNKRINLTYNNNIVRFYTDNGLSNPVKATITIGLNTVTLYPSPNGDFYFNFKELVSTILNVNNFADDLSVDLATSFVYDWTDKISLTEDVIFELFLSNNTTETATKNITWLSGYVNLRNWKTNYPSENLLIDKIDLLQLKNEDSYFNYHLNYWYGYPFDLTIYGNEATASLTNITNGLNMSIDFNKISRLIFSDGRTDVSIEDELPLQTGFNDLQFGSDFNIRLNKIINFCPDGVYVKWINSLGGWNYWLFSKGQDSKKTKDKGELFNDWNNLEDTTSPYISLGKNSENYIKLYQQGLSANDKIILEDFMDSTKVYLFNGVPFSKNDFNNWIEIKISDGDFIVENYRSKLYKFNFTLQLPPNVTRSI